MLYDKKLIYELAGDLSSYVLDHQYLRKKSLINSILEENKLAYGKFFLLSVIDRICNPDERRDGYYNLEIKDFDKIRSLVDKLRCSKKMRFKVWFPKIRRSIF